MSDSHPTDNRQTTLLRDWIAVSDGHRRQNVEPDSSTFTATSIREDRDPTPSGEDGLRALLAVEALYEAARCGTSVTIGEVA